jgi:hypothetical protein
LSGLKAKISTVPAYRPTLGMRLDIIELRISCVLFKEYLRMAEYIAVLEDPTMMSERMSEMLTSAVERGVVKARLDCSELHQKAVDASVPAIASETQLREIYLWHMLGQCIGLKATSVDAGRSNETTQVSHDTELQRVLSSLDEVIATTSSFPSTCGSLRRTAVDFKKTIENSVKRGETFSLGEIAITDPARIEKGLTHYEASEGGLALCVKGHPYIPGVVLGFDCPDCGRRVETENEIFTRTGANLQEEAFKKVMDERIAAVSGSHETNDGSAGSPRTIDTSSTTIFVTDEEEHQHGDDDTKESGAGLNEEEQQVYTRPGEAQVAGAEDAITAQVSSRIEMRRSLEAEDDLGTEQAPGLGGDDMLGVTRATGDGVRSPCTTETSSINIIVSEDETQHTGNDNQGNSTTHPSNDAEAIGAEVIDTRDVGVEGAGTEEAQTANHVAGTDTSDNNEAEPPRVERAIGLYELEFLQCMAKMGLV